MYQKSLMFYCSELGQLCIRNYPHDWMPKSRAFELVWKRYDENHYYKFMNQKEVISYEPDRLNQTKKIIPKDNLSKAVENRLKNLNSHATQEQMDETTDNDVQNLLEKISDCSEMNDVSPVEHKKLIEHVIRTETGKIAEKSTFELFLERFPNEKLKTDCYFLKKSLKFGMVDEEFKSFSRKDLWKDNIFLGGKPDAILDHQKLPMEVKMRQKRLFHGVPSYEKLQCLGYCFLTSQNECVWVQRYGRDIDVQRVLFSQKVFEKVAQILCRYSDLLAQMMIDESMCSEYCQKMKSEKTRSEFIDNFIFGHLKKGSPHSEKDGARIFI
jgi:hypothetical protein